MIIPLAVPPQFVAPERGSVFVQSIVLVIVQIAISFSVNLLIALSAAGVASWFTHKPAWLATQRSHGHRARRARTTAGAGTTTRRVSGIPPFFLLRPRP